LVGGRFLNVVKRLDFRMLQVGLKESALALRVPEVDEDRGIRKIRRVPYGWPRPIEVSQNLRVTGEQ